MVDVGEWREERFGREGVWGGVFSDSDHGEVRCVQEGEERHRLKVGVEERLPRREKRASHSVQRNAQLLRSLHSLRLSPHSPLPRPLLRPPTLQQAVEAAMLAEQLEMLTLHHNNLFCYSIALHYTPRPTLPRRLKLRCWPSSLRCTGRAAPPAAPASPRYLAPPAPLPSHPPTTFTHHTHRPPSYSTPHTHPPPPSHRTRRPHQPTHPTHSPNHRTPPGIPLPLRRRRRVRPQGGGGHHRCWRRRRDCPRAGRAARLVRTFCGGEDARQTGLAPTIIAPQQQQRQL